MKNGMDASKLMVGNWVYNTMTRKNEQVREIRENMVMLDYNDLYEYDEIEPIPLKRIHLTKNGFKANDVDDTIFVLKNGYVVKVIFSEPIEDLHIGPFVAVQIDLADAECWKDIEYVHELQNMISMFEIDEKIML